MVYANNINRVTFAGTSFGGGEIWSTGFFLGEESAAAEDPTELMAERLLTHWRVFFENATTYIHNLWLTTEVKVAQIKAVDGRVLDGSTVYAYPATELNGGSSTNLFPAQCSLVATLMSDRPRGLASKGRMYLPGVCPSIQTTGKISSVNAGTIATNLQTFFNSVRADADIPNTPILAAKGTGLFPELTAQNDYIETIKVDDVIDTQRRRRNGLAESYTTKILT